MSRLMDNTYNMNMTNFSAPYVTEQPLCILVVTSNGSIVRKRDID